MLTSTGPPAVARLTSVEIASAPAFKYSLQILRGFRSVEAAAPAITALCARTEQENNPLLRLTLFLGRVRLFPGNRPVVLLVSRGRHLEGAVYLYEKTICGVPTGYLRGFDHLTGESSVIAPEPLRSQLLLFAVRQLFLQARVRVAWATVSLGDATPLSGNRIERGRLRVETSSMVRAHRLKLSNTFDATLSGFGPHTRRNLRYYRRRAQKELQAIFQPELTATEGSQAMRQLAKSSFQPFPVSLAEWRGMDELLRTEPGYFAMGLKVKAQWLSYLVGLRAGNLTYVLMQVNHDDFPRYSLSTVLRSYFFEHEIQRGQAEIKFVNGTCTLFQRCCEPDTCLTVSAQRGLAAFVLSNWIAPWHSAPDHALNMKRWTRAEPDRRAAAIHEFIATQPKV